MTEKEIKKAIENGESVWLAHDSLVRELRPDMLVFISNSTKPNFDIGKWKLDDMEDDIEKLKRNIIELDFNRIKNSYAFKYFKKKLKSIHFEYKEYDYTISIIKRRIYLFRFDSNNIAYKIYDMKLNENNYYIICNWCIALFKGETK